MSSGSPIRSSHGLAWIYWHGARILREGGAVASMMLPTLVGVTCFLIASGTNPHLPRLDGLWVIFLPVSLIGFPLRDRGVKTVPTLQPLRSVDRRW